MAAFENQHKPHSRRHQRAAADLTGRRQVSKHALFGLALLEQTEIVRRVESLFAFADRLEARLSRARTAADRLTPALLAKAFRGELVPQDPDDEPAAELLKRLREQCEAGVSTTARKRAARASA
jgi:type I restriction enzyme S subunit